MVHVLPPLPFGIYKACMGRWVVQNRKHAREDNVRGRDMLIGLGK